MCAYTYQVSTYLGTRVPRCPGYPLKQILDAMILTTFHHNSRFFHPIFTHDRSNHSSDWAEYAQSRTNVIRAELTELFQFSAPKNLCQKSWVQHSWSAISFLKAIGPLFGVFFTCQRSVVGHLRWGIPALPVEKSWKPWFEDAEGHIVYVPETLQVFK